MIDLLSLYVCFPFSDYAIGSPENSFYPRAPVYMHYLLKDESKFPWGHHHHCKSWKGLFRWARVLFRCPGEERGRILPRGIYWRVADTSQDEALARKIPPAIFSDPLYRNSIPSPHYNTLPPLAEEFVCVGGRGRETHPRTSYAIRFLYWISRCATFQNLRTD